MLITLSVSLVVLNCLCMLLGLALGMLGWLARSLLRVSVSFLSTSRVVRKDMRSWVLSHEGDQWSVKFDVRDLGGHLDTTFRGWSSTLATRVRLVLSRLVTDFSCCC